MRQQEWQSPTSPDASYRATPCVADGDTQNMRPGACSFQGSYGPGATAYSTYAGLATLSASSGKLLAYLATIPGPSRLSRYDREWWGANLIAALNPVLPPRFSAALFHAISKLVRTSIVKSAPAISPSNGQVYIPLTCGFNPGPYAVGQVSSG